MSYSEELKQKLVNLIKEGRTIDAIIILKNETNISLKKAKTQVEDLIKDIFKTPTKTK